MAAIPHEVALKVNEEPIDYLIQALESSERPRRLEELRRRLDPQGQSLSHKALGL